MKLLALDTSTNWLSVACGDGTSWHVRGEPSGQAHSERVLPLVEAVLAEAAWPLAALDGIAFGAGPGSFTGVRVGVAAAKGLALARNIPIVGVRTADVLAYAVKWCPPPVVVVVRAGRGRWIAARYIKDAEWRQDGDFSLTTADGIGADWDTTTILCGELSESERTTVKLRLGDRVQLLPPAFSLRRPGFLAEIAWQRIQAGQIDDAALIQPIYLSPDQKVTA
jgi:tRNA threonylcarbamoyladenosine biosynthesis protein TsaB